MLTKCNYILMLLVSALLCHTAILPSADAFLCSMAASIGKHIVCNYPRICILTLVLYYRHQLCYTIRDITVYAMRKYPRVTLVTACCALGILATMLDTCALHESAGN